MEENLFALMKLSLLRELRDRELKMRRTSSRAEPGSEHRKHCNHAAEMFAAAYEAVKAVDMKD